MKDMIMKIIETNPAAKRAYEDNEGCFRNIIVPRLIECDSDSILEFMISMLATQSSIYDTILNNIAQLGDKELIKKCNDDIQKIFSSEE